VETVRDRSDEDLLADCLDLVDAGGEVLDLGL